MKRLLLIASLLLLTLHPLAGGGISKTQMTSFLTDCQRYEGVEVVQLGGLATFALRSAVKIAAADDPETRELLKLIRSIKRISVMEYEDCKPSVREKITRKLDRMLRGADLLMETKDGTERMQIYGVVDESAGTVKDFVLHTPASASLICIFGSIPIEKLTKIAAEND
ncbi:MAG: DUF4252 domain-containing protein [Bacteroidales bacterium]|nr:DUF4252 domain-containing protein [Bacteroidales bacterium]